jgi:hypothetical protein
MGVLSLKDLVRLATPELVRLALDGKLSPKDAWTALRGAEKYRRAVASGDIASESIQEERANVCWSCPSSTSRTATENITAVHCGQAYRDTGKTCGCLVLVRVNGQIAPAGKTVVASEACPQGRWQSSSRA